ncbi:glycosyltransferase family 39 protein [Anaeromicropila populeti]|uniref:Polyprenol-phosphate-mannose--protein mannosyltransferase n=1 Tax=Anaeromicropila populeti TaxID=37658 RepID=A0A1I6KIX4_9FIRM|nr:glycosyltransferase family 39 protein [Anaeromicropila populeti]SFR91185.1 Mannosyltransferase related to Gpi18 [Anaeromicropila populeti]
MNSIVLVLICYTIMLAWGYRYIAQNMKGNWKSSSASKAETDEKVAIGFLFAAAFLARIIFAVANKGHEQDMGCFIGWSDMVFQNGFGKFYELDAFTDYPPGYLYVLYFIAFLRKIFNINIYGTFGYVLIKMPAMLCDLAIAYFIVKIARQKFKLTPVLICAAFFLFNPAIILNSAIWGQVDSVYTIFVVLVCYFIMKEQLPKAYFAYALGVLIKPQILIFTPVLLFAIINQVFLKDFNWKNFGKQLGLGLTAIGVLVLLSMPFGLNNVFSQYTETLGSYEYASVNAYNFWTTLGLNWSPQDNMLGPLAYKTWGTVGIIAAVAVAAVYFFRNRKDKTSYIYSGIIIYAMVFTFSVRMHERYMYPVLALLILAFVMRPRKDIYYSFLLFSIAHFLNVAHVYYVYDYMNFNAKAAVPIVTGVITMAALAYYMVCIFRKGSGAENVEEEQLALSFMPFSSDSRRSETSSSYSQQRKKEMTIEKTQPVSKLLKKDYLAILIITVVYGCFALYDLGSRVAPETCWNLEKSQNTEIVLDMGDSVYVDKIRFFLGNYDTRTFKVEYTDDKNGTWNALADLTMNNVLYWGESQIGMTARYFRLTPNETKSEVFEIAFQDAEGNFIVPVNKDEYTELFDEQETVPARSSFRNSTYFDEIYHARTGYEFLIGSKDCYENTHPPLGKIFIALGMLIFGINPFGWRIMGTLFGIAMLPFLYVFAKRFFKESWLATIATVLFAFDFMHFSQTRIATIDVYVTFFIILMYYFMYQYTQMSFNDSSLKRTFIPLGLCGFCMGLGIASKWTGVYAGVGLAVIFFYTLYKRFREYLYAKENYNGTTNGIKHSDIANKFYKNAGFTILFCIAAFIVVPAIIYTLSYIPFYDGQQEGLVARMLTNQETMYSYHSNLVSTHPFSSRWYQWPIISRPIWYYDGYISETIREGISSMGNPLVWWMGIPAFFYTLISGWRNKDKKAGFLIIAYLAEYLPWTLVSRTTYIYHYFTSVPFVVLLNVYMFHDLVKKKILIKPLIYFYVVCAVGLFLLYYPVLSGHPVNREFVKHILCWFQSWVLIS